ncbi:MBL fold metallo-hydrolase [Ornithinicoccus halotolerans]|uniref:MBL fold metallo-hydrolase n=1 Tax=Ornithinicoccus halotolerans TaxID=1748220 RepID=UPI0012967D4E|nr:MBL fold metallo-hydrolase [Ornithinicoccus halotolerans]
MTAGDERLLGDWIRIETEYLESCGLPLWLHALPHDGGLVLLDSGTSITPETSVRGRLAEARRRLEDIDLVVNSHAHPDHMGGNAALAAVTNAAFAAPAAEAEWLEDNETVISELWEANPDAYRLTPGERSELVGLFGDRVRIDRLLRDGDHLELSSGMLRVITTSGHSPGHIAVHDQDRKLLFTFDDVQAAGVPIAGTPHKLAPLYHDVRRYRSGLRRLHDVEFELLVPSHGDPLDAEGGQERIRESLAFVDLAEEFVHDYMQRHREITLRDLAEALGTQLGPYDGVNLQTVSIARAHLDDLTRRGVVTTRWRLADS